MTPVHVALREWETASPSGHEPLSGLRLGDDPAVASTASALRQSNRLIVTELAEGVSVSATSFVGTVSLGRLRITVQPKIVGAPLLRLLRYAYGLRNLQIFDTAPHALEATSFQELLIHQLYAEASELIARGLRREYERRAESLSSPRGRIAFSQMARTGNGFRAKLPCAHHPRLEDCLVNQVLLSGLVLGARLASDTGLRVRLRQLAKLIRESVSPVQLDPTTWKRLERERSRLTAAYRPSQDLTAILVTGAGSSLADQDAPRQRLPGFLFDMNRFFQALLGRFLREYLLGHDVLEEHRLSGMISYATGSNPKNRRAPTPRPDFVIWKDGQVAAILDAKYRDLWAHELPRDMLYQLALYALSREELREAAILYPTLDEEAKESRLEISDPVKGAWQASVTLRPVNLHRLESLVSAPTTRSAEREGEAYARRLVYGAD